MKYSSAIAAITVIVFTLLFAGNISAATFIVTNTNDSGPGSLRQAVVDSYTNSTEDVINFDPSVFSTPQTITLTTGQLSIPPDYSPGPFTGVTINGPGAHLLTINGNHQSRIIFVDQNGKIAVNGVTMTGGNGTGPAPIGYITNGGAILISGGLLTMSNSIVIGNSAKDGGGIFDAGYTSLITNTAILNNSSQEEGGGIHSYRLNCVNCTISGNTAATAGGGIYVNYSGDVNVTHSTIVFNTAVDGGGISSDSYYMATGTATVKNSIISKNTSTGSLAGFDMGNAHYHSLGANILSAPCCLNYPGPQDQFNIDPKLDPQLRSNGSGIPSYALRADSPAIDHGDNCVLSGCTSPVVATDQRGVLRPQDGDGNGSAIVDIGAFELSAAELAATPAKPDLSAADDSGPSSTDNITKAQNLHFQLNGLTTGATVEVFRNGNLIQTLTAAGSSASFSDTNLPADAQFSYYARQIIGGVESGYSSSVDVTVDNTRPNWTLYQPSNQADPASFQPIRFTIGFTEPVVGLTGSHISLSDSTANVSSASVTLSPGILVSSYIISISGITSDGKVVATLPESAITDAAGNPNMPRSPSDNSVVFDTGRPTVTINQAPGQADPALTSPINFKVVFSEHVTLFSAAGVSLAGSTANVAGAHIVVTGSGANYNVAVSGVLSSGTVRASVPASAALDAAGRLNTASTSTDNIVTFSFRPAVYDFDGDGRSDVSVFRPSEGNWYLSQSLNGFSVETFGLNGDVTTPGDFDGDGITDLAIFRPSTGTWWYRSSFDRLFYAVGWGQTGDIPLAEDFNGDGRSDFVIYRPSNSMWYRFGSNNDYSPVILGEAGDIPLVADMDGDGKADPTIYRPSNGTWWYVSSVDGLYHAEQWGIAATDIPVPGDYDGDRKTDLAFFRPSDGAWFIAYSGTNYTTYTITIWGVAGDRPTPADYDGDGKADIAIYRPSDGMWFALRSASGFFSQQFGVPGDLPIPASFIP
jgi:hypothetical protein